MLSGGSGGESGLLFQRAVWLAERRQPGEGCPRVPRPVVANPPPPGEAWLGGPSPGGGKGLARHAGTVQALSCFTPKATQGVVWDVAGSPGRIYAVAGVVM